MTKSSADTWYIVKQDSEQCEIISAEDFDALGHRENSQIENLPEDSAAADSEPEANERVIAPQTWGPFTAKNQAIAKRIGLIRAGKCQPIR